MTTPKQYNVDEHAHAHLSTPTSEEWVAVTKIGRIITKSLRPTKGPDSARGEFGFLGTEAWERSVRLFRTPEDVRVGQPVLLRIRPHGEYCGCEPTYRAGVEMLGKYPDFEARKYRRTT